MKSLSLIMTFALLSMLAACGKKNESGKGNAYSNPYYGNQYGTVNSPYSSSNIPVNEIINRHPCMSSGMPNQNRVQLQQPVNLNVVLPVNDIYVGVTSVGDVALLVGQGTRSALFVSYLCQRPYSYNNQTQPQILDLDFGSKSQCSFKPITRATLAIPGSPSPIYFRWLDGGKSTGGSFGPPICNI